MGARKRLPFYPLHSHLRTIGTLAVLIAMLGAVVTISRASAQVDGYAYKQFAKVDDIFRTLKSSSSDRDATYATLIRDDELTPNIFSDSSAANTADRDNREAAESGIDGNEYVSPTYGFAVEWDDEVWTVAADEELISEIPNDLALDRLVLETDIASLYIEGRIDDTGGDMVACLDVELDLLRENDEISNLEVLRNAHRHPVAGKTANGSFTAVSFTMDDTNLTGYFECRPIDKGESVLVITLITKASDFEDAVPDMEAVTGTIAIPLRATAN